jgi:hypothetical protein
MMAQAKKSDLLTVTKKGQGFIAHTARIFLGGGVRRLRER